MDGRMREFIPRAIAPAGAAVVTGLLRTLNLLAGGTATEALGFEYFLTVLTRESAMAFTLRSCTMGVAAAALLSSQAAYAVPIKTVPAADPLVAVSIFGSAQSREAVCGTGAACTLPAMSAAAASPRALGGAASAAAMQYPTESRPGLDLAGLAVLFFVPVAIVLSIALEGGGNDSKPISPA
jgi:hypothetical protein